MRTTQNNTASPPLSTQQQRPTGRPSRPLSSARHATGSSGISSNGDGSNRHFRAAQLPRAETPTYKPLRYLGRGSFGVVLLAEDTETGERVAIKRVRYDPRLHNREVAILNSVLVDAKAPRSTDSGPTSGVKRGGSPPSPSSLPEKKKKVEIWTGSHHPNIVELMDSYITYDVAAAEADATAAAGGFHAAMHQPNYPMNNFGGPSAAGPAFAYLEMVMSYLPMDLYALKKHFYRHHTMPSAAMAFTQAAAGEAERDEEGRGLQPPPRSASRPSSPKVGTNMPLQWVKIYLFQLARALAFMHAHHVCHRDLKPANVLVDPDTGRLQLCDFGSAKQILNPGTEKNVSYICSRYYRAPELLFGALHYGCEVDMWSYGCLLAELLRESGRPLFRGCTSVDQMAELFKVMGAPSKREMYAMNPQCAEALLRTHAMHKPHHVAGTGFGTCGEAQEDDDRGLTGEGRSGTLRSGGNGGGAPRAFHDGFMEEEEEEDGRHSSAGVGLSGSAEAAQRHHHTGSGADVSALSPGEAPTAFEEYYDVLKVRAMPWKTLFPVDTPHEAVALATALLCYAPQKRLSALEVVEHDFFDELFAADPVSLRMPNGRLMPLEMFQVTETERGLFTEGFLEKMSKQAERIAAAMAKEEEVEVGAP